ncbi:MAG: hypothetical protein ACFB02_15125 [Mastigocoleus sp.]
MIYCKWKVKRGHAIAYDRSSLRDVTRTTIAYGLGRNYLRSVREKSGLFNFQGLINT